MAKQPKYLKLGPKASTFYDPVTGIDISNKMVLPYPDVSQTPGRDHNLKTCLGNGHLAEASKEEYDAYNKSVEDFNKKQAKAKEENKPEPAFVPHDEDDDFDDDEDEDEEDEDEEEPEEKPKAPVKTKK